MTGGFTVALYIASMLVIGAFIVAGILLCYVVYLGCRSMMCDNNVDTFEI